MSRVVVKGLVVFFALGALVVSTACSASRNRTSRMKLLEAEVIDNHQKSQVLQNQLADSLRSSDEANAQLQQTRFERDEFQRKLGNVNGQVSDSIGRISSAETRAEVAERRVDDLEGRVDKLLDARRAERARLAALERDAADRRRAPKRHVAVAPRGDTAELETFKRELKARMSSAGIHMPVEIRTGADGRRGVAVVLPDSFKSGKASLAYNPTAVQAVVGLGQLVQSQYAGSRVSVVGHTDADPIRRSKWRDNEELSLARASEVRGLLSDTGLDTQSIAVVGKGAQNPIARGADSRAKSRNRRVEIFIDRR